MLDGCPRLTREQEIAAWESGDTDLLIRSQLQWAMRLAVDVCRHRRFEDVDLAISAANEALIVALKSYDARKARLTTYVTMPIRYRVMSAISRERRGCGPTKYIADKYEIKLGFMSDETEATIAEKRDVIYSQRQFESLHRGISLLPDSRRFVMECRLAGKNFAQIAESLGVTKQRANQLYQDSLLRLERYLEREDIELTQEYAKEDRKASSKRRKKKCGKGPEAA
jgi:RNA polymerase sigma factor (sigma-70 family)